MPENGRPTIQDIYNIVNRVEDKLDYKISKIEEDVENLKGFQNKALGVLGLLSLFFSAIGTYLWEKVSGR